jgi:DNA-binding LytR/AlgR family response regulator
MNLVIVEESVKEARRLTRILRLIDPTIQVSGVIHKPASLQEWLTKNNAPDIFLINQGYLPDYGTSQQQVQAKLVLRNENEHVSYMALRTNTILQWQQAHKLQPLTIANNAINIEHVASKQILINEEKQQEYKKRFFVEQGQKFLSVPVEEIAYFYSDGRFIYFSTFQKNKYVISYRIEELEQLLNPELFYRINRSFIISVNSIEHISTYFGGRFKLKLIPPVTEEVLVSRKRVQGFKNWLGE